MSDWVFGLLFLGGIGLVVLVWAKLGWRKGLVALGSLGALGVAFLAGRRRLARPASTPIPSPPEAGPDLAAQAGAEILVADTEGRVQDVHAASGDDLAKKLDDLK